MLNEASHIVVAPTGGALGADVGGVDLARPLDEAAMAVLRRAWLEHLVLRFRGQRLDDAGLMAFSRRFGELDRAPVLSKDTEARAGEHVAIISNVVENGRPIGGLGASEARWHTDMSYNERPPTASLLYALEVPASGGDTGFCNMYLAWETLPEALRRRVAGLACKHDAAHNSVGELRGGQGGFDDPRTTPGAVHPLLRTHPESGRKALFLGRRHFAYVPGLDLAESEALLDELWAHVSQPHLAWYQQWRPGDLVMWDNRCTMHRRDAFDAAARRVMHRTQLRGDRPF